MNKFQNSSVFKMSIPPKFTEVRMFSDHYPNIYHKLSYNFPHYFRIYFNVTYCLLITPFRISFKDSSAKIITNPIQTVISALVNGLVCIFAILSIRRDVHAKVKDQPDVLFTVATNISWMGYILFYVMVFWSRRIHSLEKISYKPSSCKVKITGIFIVIVGAVNIILYYLVYVIFDDEFKVQPILDNFASTALYLTFQNFNTSQLVIFNEISPIQQTVALTWLIMDFFYITIICFMELFGLISAIAVYEMTCSLSPIFMKSNYGDIRVLLQHYADMKEVFGKINKVNGPIMLIIFLQIIPWISSSLIEILDENKWPNRAYMISYYLFYIGLLGLAAEANYKANIYKKRIHAVQTLEMHKKDMDNNFNRNQSSYVTNFLEGTEGSNALAGGKFFFVTYSFIGASASVLVTFSMIMVQFKTTSIKSVG